MQKHIKYLAIVSLYFLAFDVLDSQPMINYQNGEAGNYYNVKKTYDDFWADPNNKGMSGWKQYKRWEHFWSTRINSDGSFPSAFDLLSEIKNYKDNNTNQLGVTERLWKSVGPHKNPESQQSGVGRVNVIKFKPNSNKEIWMGAASGGVWMSKDHGASWKVFNVTQTLSMGISDIAFCNDFPDVAYVATGDADGIGASYGTYSAGIIKTTDGGQSWNFTSHSFETSQGNIVAKLYVHPKNPDIVVAGTSDGIYKTVDGGKSWRIKSTDGGYFRDITVKPDDPNVLLATTYSGNGNTAIYKSIDCGDTWSQVKSLSGVSRSVISFSPANPSVVYVLATQGTVFHSFLKSTDIGSTWEVRSTLSTHPNIMGYNQGNGNDKSRGQAWYDVAMAASLVDENEVYTGGINLWRTSDGGKSWNLTTHWYGGYSKPYVHADIHSLYFNENSGFLYCGSDGGVDYSDSPDSRWINLNNTLSITQYYKIAIAQTVRGIVYGGSQDNGSHRLADGNWSRVAGGDGMDCVVDYTDANRAIVSLYYGAFQKTINGVNFYDVLNQDMTGEAGDWVAPIIINPINPKSYYAGYTNVWKSVDGGSSWNKHSNFNIGTLKLLAISPSDTNYIYASNSSTLAVSSDGGRTFTNISVGVSPITGISIDRKNPKRIWITVGGFSKGNKVFMYDGTQWTNMSGNLPNVPANCIIYQNLSPDRLYIGTDIGVFMSDYNSGYWEPHGSQMPNIIVSDLEIDNKNKLLYAGTYGRGVWQAPLNDCSEAQPGVEVSGPTTFCSGGSVKLTAQASGESFMWSNGETSQAIEVTTPGIYSYSVVNGNGCVARSKTIEVKIHNVPQLKISPVGNFPVCEGDTFNLDLSATFGFSSYKWSTGETVRKIKIIKEGKYSVIALTKDGCETKAEFDVVISPIPAKPVIERVNSTQLIASESAKYQWFRNDTLLKNDTSRIIVIKEIGQYSVKVSNIQGCSSVSDFYEVSTSIDENSYTFDVYPNPTKGIVYFSDKLNGIVINSIKLMNSEGKEIINRLSRDNNDYVMDISDLSAGVYFIQINFGNETIVRKVIKY